MDSIDRFDDGANDASRDATDAEARGDALERDRRESTRARRARRARGEGRRTSERDARPTTNSRDLERAVKVFERDARREGRARAMNAEKRAEIYTYEAPWMIYACNWSVRGERGDGLGTRAREN